MRRIWTGTLAALATALYASGAFAQEGSAGASATVTTPPAVVATTTTTQISTKEGTPDHDQFVGHLGVGFFGISQLPIAAGGPGGGGGGLTRANVNAPVVGVRYWLQRNIGIDAGIGFGLTSGSVEQVAGGTSVTVDKPSVFGFALHGGVPLAFAHAQHFTFLVIPEATVGFASGTIKTATPPGGPVVSDQDLSGFRLDLGARIGAEIHFGFIGIPQLSLEGSVGLFFRRESFKWKQDNNSVSDGTNTFATSVQADPWAIFVNNISARYYF